MFLENEGTISASSSQGAGGDVTLNLTDFLFAREGSSISAEAGLVNGGSINLNVGNQIFLDPGSKITAGATGFADGGNITINTTFLTGTEATTWQVSPGGELALVAQSPNLPSLSHPPTCAKSAVTATAY